MLRRVRRGIAVAGCWVGVLAGAVGTPWLPAAAMSSAVETAPLGLGSPALPPNQPPYGPAQRARLATTAVFFPTGDDGDYLDGGTFVLPVPLPWPAGADTPRNWELEVPGTAPVFVLAAVSPTRTGFVPGTTAITVDGIPISSPESFAVGGLQLPEADGLKNYSALAFVIPAFPPGRHAITVACNGCTTAPPNPWLSAVNAGPRNYVLNVQPPRPRPAAANPPDSVSIAINAPLAVTLPADGSLSTAVLPDTANSGTPPTLPAQPVPLTRADAPRVGTTADRTFYSAVLGRQMPYRVYLPPDYDAPGPDGEPSTKRYPVVYLLHGLGGSMKQWSRLGLDDELNRLAAAGERVPFIVVTPTGLAGYWVNHADGGPLWGDYVTKDLVSYVDATYRTIARRDARAIGGISMGGHGALQLTLNNPGLFGVVGAHSPALRPRPDAPPFLGGYFVNLSGGPGQAAYEARDPISLVRHSTLATPPAMWIDTGDKDPWMPRVQELHAALVAHGWAHEWQPAKGDHDGGYWHRRMADYVGFYRRALQAVA